MTCPTLRQPLNVTVIPTPVVNLPIDTFGCNGRLILDAGNIGANYLWSNGLTTGTIQLTGSLISDSISLIVNIGICADSATVKYFITDSISFQTYDTTLCGGNIELSVINNAAENGLVYWWDSLNNGNVINIGDKIITSLFDSTTYFAEIRPVVKKTYEGSPNNFFLGTNIAGYYPFNGDYGNFFDVRNEIYLDSLTIYVDNSPLTATLQIINPGATVIFQKNITLLPGTNKISINFNLTPGTNYRMMLKNLSGPGLIFCDAPTPFPLNYENITVRNGFPFPNNNYFYNWVIRKTACPGTRKPININVLPTKNINWPQDTIICSGSINLDISYPNSSYLWNDGQTTSSITISAADTVWAEVSTGTCVSRDTMLVFISTPPTQLYAPSDTLVCGGLINLTASGNAAAYAWYNQSSGGLPIAYGSQISLNLTDSTVIYIEGLNLLRSAGNFGHQTVPTTNGAFTNIATSNYPTRGLLFDVYKTLRLDEISMFSDGPLNASIVLKNDLGFEINRQNISLSTGGETVITLNWILEPGNNYSLWLEDIQGSGRLYVVSNYGFPMVYPELRIRNGLPQAISNQYNSFYKWKISTPACATPRQAVTIDVPEYPNITMPADTAICNGNNLTLTGTDGTQNYNYIWNTGSTDNSINVLSPSIYSVSVSNSGCSSVKNSLVQFPVNPTSPQIADSTICSPNTLNLLENPQGGIVLWSSLGAVNYISAPFTVNITDTTSFTVEYAARAQTRIGAQSHPNPNDINRYESFILSNTFDVLKPSVLDSVAVYLNAPGSVDIVLADNQNNILQRRTVNINAALSTVYVPLDFVLLPANGYQLYFDNIGNKQFLVDRFVSYPQSSSSEIASLTGTAFSGVSYNCFYDWHFSYALDGCYAPANDVFTINVSLPVNLQDSVYTCNDALLDAAVPSAVSYIWNTGATTSVILANQSGLYTVTVSDGAACSYIASTEVATPDEIIFDDNNGSICGNLLGTNYDDNNQFVWSTGSTNPQLTVNNPGFYALSILTEEGCVVNDSILISTIETPPAVNIGDVLNICSGATLDAGFSNQGMTYLWNNGATTQTIEVSSSGSYSVTVTSQTGCDGSDFVFVNEVPLPSAGFNYVISGNAVAFTSTSTDATTVQWAFGDGISTTLINPFHLYPGSGCYQVTQIASNSCGSDTIVRFVPLGVDPAGCGVTVAYGTVSSYDLSVFPNPNRGIFTLQINSLSEKSSEIIICGVDGRQLLYQNLALKIGINKIDIQVQNWPSGIYILKFRNSEISKDFKIIISE